MYDLRYLPIAQRDMEEIILYIADVLKAPKAALDLLDEFEHGFLRLKEFPYSCRVYEPVKRLETEYRVLVIKKYLAFYTVLEKEKTVEIHRVVYGKMDLPQLLKD